MPEGETFDLVFSSPPFFDFEIYTDAPGQSTQSFPEYEDWLVNFLFFAMNKCWSVLEDDGHMAIHITDVVSEEKEEEE